MKTENESIVNIILGVRNAVDKKYRAFMNNSQILILLFLYTL